MTVAHCRTRPFLQKGFNVSGLGQYEWRSGVKPIFYQLLTSIVSANRIKRLFYREIKCAWRHQCFSRDAISVLAQAKASLPTKPEWLKWQLIKSIQHPLPAGLLLPEHDARAPVSFKKGLFSSLDKGQSKYLNGAQTQRFSQRPLREVPSTALKNPARTKCLLPGRERGPRPAAAAPPRHVPLMMALASFPDNQKI